MKLVIVGEVQDVRYCPEWESHLFLQYHREVNKLDRLPK